jgi:hypothetical protein
LRTNSDLANQFNQLRTTGPYCTQKSLYEIQNWCIIRAISSHPEGRTRRHLRGTRMRWTRAVPGEGMRRADGKGVWSCPPDAGVNPRVKSPGRRRLASPVLRGERAISRKPLRRECRTIRLTCTDLWASFLFSPRGLRVRPAPGIPCALRLSEGQRRCKARACHAARMLRCALIVIASEAKQSICPLAARWIASSLRSSQ